ncbi:MAG: GAF domain-containing SpoIIE family protein phosphatase [Ilumatobacteraceae bacterium]
MAANGELEHRLAVVASIDVHTRSTDELVHTLLERLRDELAADTATVLVVDPSGSHLVALAAIGLEDEVLQGFRIKVGAGFSGRVAETRTPTILDEVTSSTVTNPIILNRGLRSMAAVPLIATGTLIGVLHTGSESPAFFDHDDLAVMQVIGERIATALVMERSASERSAALILQRSLLPSRLPEVEGIEMASRFVPAAGFGLGGDWFDAFVLPDDSLGIVMGDVTGSGLAAAVVMGRLRSALRAYAIDAATPAEALDKLNRKFMHFEPGQMATVLYFTISPDRETVTIASAGHPPPIGASPGEAAQFLACVPRPPIGVPSDRPCVVTHVPLPRGTTLACFTDGLYERRTAPIDRQLERLRAAVTADDPETVCSTVMGAMVGSHLVEDDTALLALIRTR